MTGTRMEMQFVKACSNVVDNTVLEEVLQKNLEEVEREPYTEAELEFAKKLAGTYGGGELDVQDLLKRYEKSRKAEVEAFLNAHKDDVICDYIVPLKDTETVMAGSTDVGDVSWVCPTAQINAVTEAAGTPGHSCSRCPRENPLLPIKHAVCRKGHGWSHHRRAGGSEADR